MQQSVINDLQKKRKTQLNYPGPRQAMTDILMQNPDSHSLLSQQQTYMSAPLQFHYPDAAAQRTNGRKTSTPLKKKKTKKIEAQLNKDSNIDIWQKLISFMAVFKFIFL